MVETAVFEPGNYTYIRGPFQYSGGIAPLPGYSVERVTFMTPPAIEPGFKLIKDYLTSRGLPLTSFAACELRSPAPFDDAGFIAFNRIYVGTLERWGIFKDDENPVARSNVCPEVLPPSEPVFHAFSYIVPTEEGAPQGFVTAGGAEAREGPGDYAENTVRHGETTPDAILEKAQFTLGAMEIRMTALGYGWKDATTIHVYTVHDFHPFIADEIAARDAARKGLTWFYARPPVVGIEFEMDVRCVPVERVI